MWDMIFSKNNKGYCISMGLRSLLENKKSSIVKKWFEFVIDTYAPDAALFFKNQGDNFLNPVGGTTRSILEKLFETLLKDADADSIAATMEPLIKIRAVQNFSPSQAVGFLFVLKILIRKELKKELKKINPEELVLVDTRIDSLALIGFDVFVRCREKIYDLRTNTERSKIYTAFARAGLIKEIAADEPDLKFV
ncbi:MAG: RsbRD N-terminal domain-containing protein [Deltaproteobacteria bacterium]|nr:RsbRD N-terminal domain-containing protein [Deltaproteobacteria bacterium]